MKVRGDAVLLCCAAIFFVLLTFISTYLGRVKGHQQQGHQQQGHQQQGHRSNASDLSKRSAFFPLPLQPAAAPQAEHVPKAQALAFAVSYVVHVVASWVVAFSQLCQSDLRPDGATSQRHLVSFVVHAFSGIARSLLCNLLGSSALSPFLDVATCSAAFVVLLALLLAVECRDRGLAVLTARCGYRSDLVRRYHGFVFVWIAVTVYWATPEVASLANVATLVVCQAIMLHGMLAGTRLHRNRIFRSLVEALVLLVWLFNSTGASQIFVAAFSVLFLIATNQIFVLEFWGQFPVWPRFLPVAVCACACFACVHVVQLGDTSTSTRRWLLGAQSLLLPSLLLVVAALVLVASAALGRYGFSANRDFGDSASSLDNVAITPTASSSQRSNLPNRDHPKTAKMKTTNDKRSRRRTNLAYRITFGCGAAAMLAVCTMVASLISTYRRGLSDVSAIVSLVTLILPLTVASLETLRCALDVAPQELVTISETSKPSSPSKTDDSIAGAPPPSDHPNWNHDAGLFQSTETVHPDQESDSLSGSAGDFFYGIDT